MITQLNEISYTIAQRGSEKVAVELRGCNGCMYDPTYDQLKQLEVCLTDGCDGQSKYKARFSISKQAREKTMSKVGL